MTQTAQPRTPPTPRYGPPSTSSPRGAPPWRPPPRRRGGSSRQTSSSLVRRRRCALQKRRATLGRRPARTPPRGACLPCALPLRRRPCRRSASARPPVASRLPRHPRHSCRHRCPTSTTPSQEQAPSQLEVARRPRAPLPRLRVKPAPLSRPAAARPRRASCLHSGRLPLRRPCRPPRRPPPRPRAHRSARPRAGSFLSG
mmetsp:Transcript_22728/g.77325  ORF Transcript_22728/g.77325 Transcript_22728/m.77325 type:complete len:200 (-) Transcript_22728:373-972(-)